MYIGIFLEFGRESRYDNFTCQYHHRQMDSLEKAEEWLFNHRIQESELGEIFYIRHYGGDTQSYGLYMSVVKESDAEAKKKAKGKLLEAALKSVKDRMTEDEENYRRLTLLGKDNSFK